jgi:hypothetical protein
MSTNRRINGGGTESERERFLPGNGEPLGVGAVSVRQSGSGSKCRSCVSSQTLRTQWPVVAKSRRAEGTIGEIVVAMNTEKGRRARTNG